MARALLTQRAAADYLGVSPDLIRRWTKAGTIPIYRDHDGARILYPRLALDAMFDELGRQTARQAPS